jgi:general secretion pathway protein K
VSAPQPVSCAQRQRPCQAPQRQRGIALLVAILLVALGTILAAAVAYENAMTARRGSATYAFDQAVLIGEGAEAIAAYGLRQIKQSDPQHTYVGQGWDKPYGPLEVVPGVTLTAQLEDLQGRFNLNWLVNTDGTPNMAAVNDFVNLLALLGLEPKWAYLLVDWIDADIQPTGSEGAEDSVYMGQTPPYRTANRYITSASELLALPGFGRDRYLRLAPYVVALPARTALNVCTAPGIVLDAFIGPGHSEFGADPNQLAQSRANSTGCFPTVANFQAAIGQGGGSSGQNAGIGNGINGINGTNRSGSGKVQFAQNSSYFRLTSEVTMGSTEFNLYSLMYQDQTGTVRAIQRSFTPD